jgi:SAM-dependent methyltransferase
VLAAPPAAFWCEGLLDARVARRQHVAALSEMQTLVRRRACPVCAAEPCRVVLDLPYDTDPISAYLKTFYSGRFDLSLVAGERFEVDKCLHCGLLFQRFVPNPPLLNELYGSVAIADRQEVGRTRGLSVRQSYSHQVEQMIMYWGGDPSALRVLDFGSGTGLWLRMVDAYGCEAHAAELVASHATQLEARGVTVHLVDRLPVENFHFINAEQVFEHLVAPAEVVRRLARSLVPGGLLRISVPNGASIESLLGEPDWTAPKGSPRSLNAIAPLEHINCFTRASLITLGVRASLHPFEHPFRRFMHSTERVRFIASALLHLVWRRRGSLVTFQRPA